MEFYLLDVLLVLIFSGIGIILIALIFGLSKLISTAKPSEVKESTYECGNVPIGESWIQFRVRYYIFALLFVILDIEMIFLFPWAIVFQRMGLFALIEMAIFVGLLVVGLVYAWRKGALKWV